MTYAGHLGTHDMSFVAATSMIIGAGSPPTIRKMRCIYAASANRSMRSSKARMRINMKG